MDDEARALPATKGDLEDLRNSTRADIEALREDLKEQIRDSQTEVLRAFYNFSKSLEVRLRMQDATTTGLGERMSVLETRMTEVERRLNMPN